MMKKTLHVVICLVTLLCSTALAQNPSTRAEDEKAIRAIIVELNEGWSTGNAEPWGRHFTPDADFVAVTSRYYKGREAIEKGHQALFTGRSKDTKQRYDVQSIRFLRDDVAVVHCKGNVVPKDQEFPKEHTGYQVMIFVKEKGRWQIAVFQNTPLQNQREQTPRQVAKVDPQIYDAYVGQYQILPNLILTVTREGDKLMGQATGDQAKTELLPESDATFYKGETSDQVVFVRDEKGQVTHITFRSNGPDRIWKKIK